MLYSDDKDNMQNAYWLRILLSWPVDDLTKGLTKEDLLKSLDLLKQKRDNTKV
jgi:hypothetical protein